MQAVFYSVRKPNYDGVANLGSHLGDHDDVGAIIFCQKQQTERKHTFGF